MNNREFAIQNKIFLKCCELSGLKPHLRQASKFKRGLGKAYQFIDKAKKLLEELNGN